MKSTLLKFVFLFIATSCICGMCSKGDETTDDNNNNTNDPVLAKDASWVYFDDCRSLTEFYNSLPGATAFNNRPVKKWIATKINTAIWGYSGSNPSFLVWDFENNVNTRFLQDAGNPGGKETFSISLKNMDRAPVTGSYTLDIDYKQGYCWYEVYTSSGTKHDSIRTQGLSSSTFNITSMTFDKAIVPTVDRYKMSGNATFNIMYWQNGTSSTSDIHTLQCTFNNVPVNVTK